MSVRDEKKGARGQMRQQRAGVVVRLPTSCAASALALGTAVGLPWLGAVLSGGAALEEATRSNLLVFVGVHLLLSLVLSLLLRSRTRLVDAGLAVVGGSCLFYAVAVLFGAPVLTQADQTLLWASLMAVLVALPLATTASDVLFGAPSREWRLSNATAGEVMAMLSALGAALGAWVGAFSIPLDWDRPWQPFPISSTYAALWGHAIGHLLALAYILISAAISHLSPRPPPRFPTS